MNILKRLYLKCTIKKDEKFLTLEGFRKAKRERLQINIGGKYIYNPENKEDRIYLPPAEKGVDSKNLIALVADDYPEITKRYFKNKKKLTR